MAGIQKRLVHLGLAGALCALCAGGLCAQADPPASQQTAAGETLITRMRELDRQERWHEIVERFADADFAEWPDAPEAFHLRGKARLFLHDPAKAEPDLKLAVERDPKEGFYWYFLAEAYAQLRRDEAATLAAYMKAFELENNYNWMPADAALKAADILLEQVRPDEALEILQRYDGEHLAKMPDVWRYKLLRAYARAYAALGREAEARIKFREALIVESHV